MWMPSWLSRTFSQGPACSVHQTTPTKRGQAHRWRPILIARSESKRSNSKRTDPVWIGIAWLRFRVLNEFMQSAPVVTLARYSATFPSQFMTAKVGKYETNLVKKPEVPKAPHGTWHQGAPWTLDRIGSGMGLLSTFVRPLCWVHRLPRRATFLHIQLCSLFSASLVKGQSASISKGRR